MTKANNKNFANFTAFPRMCISRELTSNNKVIIHGTQYEEVDARFIRTPEEDIRDLRDNIYNLSNKLEKSISARLEQEQLEPQAVVAFVKLVDSFLKITNVEFLIYDGKNISEEKKQDINEEDQQLLNLYKKEMMAPRAGLEPATERLTAACSTTELPRNWVSWNFIADYL